MKVDLSANEWSVVIGSVMRAQDTIYRESYKYLEKILEKINDQLAEAGE